MPDSSAAQDRFAAYREKAERRGRIRHPEGDRYETPDWLDVLVLLDENERLRASLRRIELWPFDVGHTPERDLREIKEAAHDALA